MTHDLPVTSCCHQHTVLRVGHEFGLQIHGGETNNNVAAIQGWLLYRGGCYKGGLLKRKGCHTGVGAGTGDFLQKSEKRCPVLDSGTK